MGAPIVDVYGSLVAGLEDACGGSLCVEVVVQAEDGKGAESTCQFDGTDPPGGSEVSEGDTVTFLTKPDCEGSVDETDGGANEPDDGDPSGSTTSDPEGEDGQSPDNQSDDDAASSDSAEESPGQ